MHVINGRAHLINEAEKRGGVRGFAIIRTLCHPARGCSASARKRHIVVICIPTIILIVYMHVRQPAYWFRAGLRVRSIFIHRVKRDQFPSFFLCVLPNILCLAAGGLFGKSAKLICHAQSFALGATPSLIPFSRQWALITHEVSANCSPLMCWAKYTHAALHSVTNGERESHFFPAVLVVNALIPQTCARTKTLIVVLARVSFLSPRGRGLGPCCCLVLNVLILKLARLPLFVGRTRIIYSLALSLSLSSD